MLLSLDGSEVDVEVGVEEEVEEEVQMFGDLWMRGAGVNI